MTALRVFRSAAPEGVRAIEGLRAQLREGGLTAADARGERSIEATVREIIGAVRDGGDAAAADLERKLDGADLSPSQLRVPAELLRRAHASADPGLLELMRRAADNVRSYQNHILWRSPGPLVRGGRSLTVRYRPMDRVAVYVPGGRALYPSSVLMTVVPAQVAGVKEIVMLSPPTGGEIDPMAMALAFELGVSEVYRLGGAVGLAAVAYGTESIRPVDKVVGPGNAYVAEAKRQLFGHVGIDAIAGPSEVFIVADETADPAWVAADLLAQAEHDPASAVLATPSEALAARVVTELEQQVAQLERGDAARSSIERFGCVIVTEDLPEACQWAERFASEHLQIVTADDAGCMERISSAGAIFLGGHTPVPLGDYVAGPSHVLPTGGTARFTAPLSCNEFLKASSILHYDRASLLADAADVEAFARREGLTAHARAVAARKGAVDR